MASDDTELARRARACAEKAREDQAALRPDAAAERYREALVFVTELMERRPDEPRHVRSAGSIGYALGSLYSTMGRFEQAVEALDGAAGRYSELVDAGIADAVPWLADVQARRGLALMYQGRGASAVLDLDEAVTTYQGLGRPADLARVLAMNALVVSTCGDPDMAADSAREAIRRYGEPGAAADDDHTAFVAIAEQVLATVAANGADAVPLRLALDLAPGLLPPPKDARARAVARILAPAEGEPVVCPSARCPAANAPAVARDLAHFGATLMGVNPAVGLRLALEAHFLFAAASRENSQPLRDDFGAHGPFWVTALAECCRIFREEKDLAMAGDLADWLDRVLTRLAPDGPAPDDPTTQYALRQRAETRAARSHIDED